MTNQGGPVIVRAQGEAYYLPKPGVHSHNARRRANQERPPAGTMRGLRVLLIILGIGALGYYGYTVAYQYLYQSYANWVFEQQIAKPPVSIATPRRATPSSATPNSATPGPVNGAVLGKVEIGRLNLSAIVRQGVDAKTLSIAVGHVPSTTLPGAPGNFVIAAHRDTLFRALKDIKKDDLVTMQTAAGNYTYQVLATKIVKPTDVTVLQPDGGGLIPAADAGAQPSLLTMITCYPFYYVGSAPKRFIVEAKLVSQSAPVHAPNGGV